MLSSFYPYLVAAHNWGRWIVVVVLLFGLVYAFVRNRAHMLFSKQYYQMYRFFTHVFLLQFLLGILLMFTSPYVRGFFENMAYGVKLREIRFFGLEHPTMMIFSILMLQWFTFKSKKHIDTHKGFRYIYRVYLVLFVVIFLSIPWWFSPFTARPAFR